MQLWTPAALGLTPPPQPVSLAPLPQPPPLSYPFRSPSSSHQDDEKFLTDLFAQLTDEATEDDKRHELVSADAKNPKAKLTLSFVPDPGCG